MQKALKPILLTALGSGQIDYHFANAIAAAAGVDLTEVIDPAKTADDLIHISRKLHLCGAIDEVTAKSYELVAESIFNHLYQFEIA